jgi:hypothetical protein
LKRRNLCINLCNYFTNVHRLFPLHSCRSRKYSGCVRNIENSIGAFRVRQINRFYFPFESSPDIFEPCTNKDQFLSRRSPATTNPAPSRC